MWKMLSMNMFLERLDIKLDPVVINTPARKVYASVGQLHRLRSRNRANS